MIDKQFLVDIVEDFNINTSPENSLIAGKP